MDVNRDLNKIGQRQAKLRLAMSNTYTCLYGKKRDGGIHQEKPHYDCKPRLELGNRDQQSVDQ